MSSETSTSTSDSQRLMSLDALRGFDMFWILGADSFVYALHETAPRPRRRNFSPRNSTMPNGRAFISTT